MTDNVFENYYKNTVNDFNKMYSNNNENNIPKRNMISRSKKTFITNKNNILLKKFFHNSHQTSEIKDITMKFKNISILKTICQGYCYDIVINNKCSKWGNCRFKHNVCIIIFKILCFNTFTYLHIKLFFICFILII